ncbi:MAG TPA: hypothetical protein VN966_05915 [Candidatus Bathyarchaeia archaeon]|nr:hypothetical protein [Candidatus Bathyarchaeia archaeon]
MKKQEVDFWHEELQFCSDFTNGNDKLTLFGAQHYERGSPNAKHRSVLEFFGDCAEEDGEIVKRKKRYDISPELSANIIEALKKFAPFEKDRPPKIGRERFRKAADGFVVSLKQTPAKTFFTLHRPDDGWKFETEDRDGLFGAFSDAAGG